MASKLASLSGWQLVLALGVLGVGSYFVISAVLHLAASLIPLVSALGAVTIVAWVLHVGHRRPAE